MVEVKHGQNKKLESSKSLTEFFNSKGKYNGKLYVGYPILYTGGENIVLDAIWISPEKGIIVFDLIEGTTIEDRNIIRDNLYNKIESELRQYSELNAGRHLQIPIEIVTFAPACSNLHDYAYTANVSNLEQIIDNIIPNWVSYTESLFKSTISIIQSVIRLNVVIDRTNVKKDSSKGAIVKRLEETIANLDNQQESAIIEYYDGLQRIRGLAGSGKTIVLALKAAYLHAINPDWNIVVTFNTRALKNQFKELIELFCIQKIGRKPDEERIKIIQAWGSSTSTGIYYEFCKDNSIEYLDFRSARNLGNKLNITPFDAACQKALKEVIKGNIIPKYDAILVDEAQDLAESFLNLSYRLLRGKNKRLIYAYDELQKLHEGSPLRNPRDIFNNDRKFSDIILKKCYRNPRPVLVTAHALGFGIYSKKGLIQFFDQPELWGDLGYVTTKGVLEPGQEVILSRTEQTTHTFLEKEVPIDEIINFTVCDSKEEQAEKIAQDIFKNLNDDELLHRDIIVINPMALTTKEEVALIRARLNNMKIRSHIAGEVNKDEFFQPNSIAFTGINRAKGNEVPVVYIINGQDCYSHPVFDKRGLRERRNILFTAITRSKAWVKVYGIGENMKKLSDEFKDVKENDYSLNFSSYPSKEEIERINVISRDISEDEENVLKSETDSLLKVADIVQKIKKGESDIEDYPEEVQSVLKLILKDNED